MAGNVARGGKADPIRRLDTLHQKDHNDFGAEKPRYFLYRNFTVTVLIYFLLILAKVSKNLIYQGLLFFVAMKLMKSMKPFQSTSLAILLFYSNGLTNTFCIIFGAISSRAFE